MREVKKNGSAYILALPYFVLFLIFTGIPVVISLPIGFTSFNMVQFPTWVGLSNFYTLFLQDDVFLIAIQNTLVFAIITGPVSYILCFLLAWLINEMPGALKTVFTYIFYAPTLAGNIFATWQLIFSGDTYGFLNSTLMDLGLIKGPQQWLTDARYILMCVIIVQMWMSLGAGFLSLRAGFQGLDKSGYEAGAIEGIKFMFAPNFQPLKDNFIGVLATAGGQMFFSLSLGMGAMITYGSYLDKKQNLEKNAITIVILDTLVALMAGLCVIPARFALDPTGALGGPSLLFVTMQNVFQAMGGIGPVFGILFYVLVVFAAISSSISLLEVIVAHFVDKAAEKGKGDKRKKYTLIAALCVAVGCILVCADRLGMAGIHPAALLGMESTPVWAADWLDFFDCISEGIMMPIGALLTCMVVGWEVGPNLVKEEVEQNGNKFKTFGYFKFCVRIIAPLGLLMVLYGQLTSFFG